MPTLDLPLIQISPDNLKGIIRLFRDDDIPVDPLDISYKDYRITHPGGHGAKVLQQFTWTRGAVSEPLSLKLSNWDTKQKESVPYSYLTITRDGGSEIVGFSLGLLVEDAYHIYPGFRIGNGEGGKNRWFGRNTNDLRTSAEVNLLGQAIRQAWVESKGRKIIKHPQLPGEWLVLWNISQPDVKPGAKSNSYGKNIVIREFLKAFLIAEKLRDESIATAKRRLANTTSVHPLNQILYGPPGTGKTYSTAEWALAMLQNRPVADIQKEYQHRHDQVREELAKYREREQVQFVTFHQSFSYEDFVEGIKPKLSGELLSYRVEPGVFQRLSHAAKRAWQYPGQTATVAAPVADFDTVYAAYIMHLQDQLKELGSLPVQTMTGAKAQITEIKSGDAIVMKHEGSQYAFTIGKKWSWLVYEKYERAEDIVPMNQKMLEIGGPNASLQWALFRHFKSFEQQYFPAEQNPDAAALAPIPAADGLARFVLIIDEVNRGNVASIFGELITLLEDDKRAGQPDEQIVQLPYSKSPFTVPPNLHLLGTMNTADRSVEALDTALRRRFAFIEMPPQPALLSQAQMVARLWWRYAQVDWKNKEYRAAEKPLFELLGCPLQTAEEQGPLWQAIQDGKEPQQILAGVVFTGVNLQLLLEAINKRLEYLLGRDYRLGHAWLMNVSSLDKLRQAFRNKVIPQLQEYFYGNWGRIGQILGPDFVIKAADDDSPLLQFGVDEGEGRPLYEISSVEWTIKNFRDIYTPQP
jgi:5-methylcytosine-specific restriction protein B